MMLHCLLSAGKRPFSSFPYFLTQKRWLGWFGLLLFLLLAAVPKSGLAVAEPIYSRPNRPVPPLTEAELARQQQLNANVNFTSSLLRGEITESPTSLQFGPDGRLYVADLTGLVHVYTINQTRPNDYEVTAVETITAVKNIPNHNDDGTPNPNETDRQITGLLVTGSAETPTLYVSSSDPRIGGFIFGETNLDTNSGIISRLTQSTPGSWASPTKLDLVRGLPRSEENHSVNGMALSADGNTLFLAVGGNTNMGAPSTNFAFLPEYALAAAILSIDLAAIGDTSYDLPTLDDPTRGGGGQPPENDPFGGNDGLNQARWLVGGPVQVYAGGFRNPFDVVLREDGRLFSIDNGPNASWGNRPIGEGVGGNCTNEENNGGETQWDALHYIDSPGYYGGHPNPVRGNPQGIFGSQANAPVDFALANPQECDHRNVGDDGSLISWSSSTNGFAEYTASTFGGSMQGDLLATGWNSQNIFRVKLSFDAADNPTVELNSILFSSVGDNPLDLTTQGDNDPFPGTIWVASLYGGGPIHIYEPVELGDCTAADDPALDEDQDGYDNADELDNGTDPCNSADQPADFDRDFISDLNDDDDDNDGILDLDDLFAVDAANGTATTIPVVYTWDNDVAGAGGLLGLGWTGVMNNGVDDYLTLFDETQMTAGGAGGLMTIDAVPEGTAVSNSNSQQYGFQFGVSTATSLPFTAHTDLLNPFADATVQDSMAQGLFMGRGDQDNYVALLLAANGGAGGLRLIREIDGVVQTDQTFGPGAGVTPLGSNLLDLYLTVDPLAATVQASYAMNGGTRTLLGNPMPIPTSWLGDANALAVGVMATSAGPAAEFTATWDSIEVFFETTDAVGAWTAVSASNDPIARHENGFIQLDGKLYLVGGRGRDPVQIYDPQTNSWSDGAVPPLSLHHFQAVAFNGMIAVVGAYNGPCCFTEFGVDNIYFYNPVTDAWLTGPAIPFARQRGAAAAFVYNGDLYMVGGLSGGHGIQATSYAWFDRYDPETNAWFQLEDAPRARDHAQAAVVGNKLYLLGGRQGNDFTIVGGTIAEVDVYDFNSGHWSTLPASSNIPTPRAGAATAVLGNEIIVIGGESGAQNSAHVETEAFDTRSHSWRTLAPLNEGRQGTQTAVCNETLYIVAGAGAVGGSPELATMEQFALGEPRPCLPTPPPASNLRINAGGPAVVSSGNDWQADTHFFDGFTFFTVFPIDGTSDDVLYQTERFGNFSYNIPLVSGCYEVDLHFAEILWPTAGRRLFNVMVEEEAVLAGFDIAADTGGINRAVVKTFAAAVIDNELNIDFVSVQDNAKLSALEVRPATGDCTLPPPPAPTHTLFLPLLRREG